MGRTSRRRSMKPSRRSRMTGSGKPENLSRKLKKDILSNIKKLTRGAGRLEAWQGKYPVVGTGAWDPSNNICKHPELVSQVFDPPGSRSGGSVNQSSSRIGGRGLSKRRQTMRLNTSKKQPMKNGGGEYLLPEKWFGRTPINYKMSQRSPDYSV